MLVLDLMAFPLGDRCRSRESSSSNCCLEFADELRATGCDGALDRLEAVLAGPKEAGTAGTTAVDAATEGTKADCEVPACTSAAVVASLELEMLSDLGEFAMISAMPGMLVYMIATLVTDNVSTNSVPLLGDTGSDPVVRLGRTCGTIILSAGFWGKTALMRLRP